jgi:hypothetical protein
VSYDWEGIRARRIRWLKIAISLLTISVLVILLALQS